MDSDHMPLELALEGRRRREQGKEIQKREEKEKEEMEVIMKLANKEILGRNG